MYAKYLKNINTIVTQAGKAFLIKHLALGMFLRLYKNNYI